MEEQITELLKKINIDAKVEVEDNEEVIISNNSWADYVSFSIDHENLEETLNQIERYFKMRYIPYLGCYCDNYVELILNLSSVTWGSGLDGVALIPDETQISDGGIIYEISSYSHELMKLLNFHQDYQSDLEEDWFTSIKILNINSTLAISTDDPNIVDHYIYIAKNILFDLSSRHSVDLKLYEIIDDTEYDDADEVFDTSNRLQEVNVLSLKHSYDSDLLEYYYKAQMMDDSKFKYLAFYQILECIFDEVFQYELVQDVKQVINSNWFSSYNDDHVTQMIKIVEQYNIKKNDHEKLRLVLEKYFKGETHDSAYLVANKDIIFILQNRLGLLKKEDELKNISNLAKIIYEFRCECTHSNRKFTTKYSFEKTNDELHIYIELIKLVSARIISNYKVKNLI
ncbi:hypothetical protein [Paenibacillus amylolyticus]|uniref:hypothetical protein n=1 Tax=Paenibacillus amylolyticus TaxID=1451 RepID=UPI003D96E065